MPPSHSRVKKPAPDSTLSYDGTSDKATERREAIHGILQLAQFGCVMSGQLADAGAIGKFGPPLADEVYNLAEQNPRIMKRIDLLLEVGPYAGIVAAGLPLVIQVLVNHKVVKADSFANSGVVTPQTLESQMRATLLEQQMEALRQQRDAEEQMREMHAQMQSDANEMTDADKDMPVND